MTKADLQSQLISSHTSLIEYINELSKEEFEYHHEDKWSAGQQLDHIKRCVAPVALAFRVPKVLLKRKYGLANRPSRTYDGLVEKYAKALESAYHPPRQFRPRKIPFTSRGGLKNKLSRNINQLCRRLNRYSEHDLDRFILPHPLLGKVTLREMCYFTIYHAHHHLGLAKKYLDLRP